jgi:hypothetical protein
MNKHANILSSAGRFIAHNPGSTSAIGAGLGGALGVAREAARGEGEKNYVAGGVLGALRGGLAGAGVAAIGRGARDTMLLNPQLSGAKDVAKATLARAGEGVGNFARRQVHGITGHGANDKAYLDRIGITGSGTAAKRVHLDTLRAQDLAKHSPGSVNSAEQAASMRAHFAEGDVGDRMRDLGMTHAPGAVKAFAKDPRAASKAVWDQLRLGGGLGVAAGVGVPVAVSGADLARGDESAAGGRSLGEKSMRAVGNIGGGLVFSGLPMLSQNVVGQGVEYLSGRVGRALGGSRPAPAQIG